MKVRKLLALPAALVFSCLPAVGEVEAVSFEKVSLSDSFWSQWREKQASSTIPAALKNTQNAADNLEIAGLMRRGLPHKRPQNLVRFISSDLYKIMESASCSLMVLPNPALEARIDKIAGLIEAAQLDDGYLFVPHICGLKIGGIGKTPYSMVAVSHELYNVGHLYETAIAYCRATGKDTLLRVSEKSARHIEKVIFKGDPKYNGGKPILEAPGHQEIELALCRLAKETGKPEYLETAIKLLELRGRNEYARKLLAEGGRRL